MGVINRSQIRRLKARLALADDAVEIDWLRAWIRPREAKEA
jgi:hypothetical protein